MVAKHADGGSVDKFLAELVRLVWEIEGRLAEGAAKLVVQGVARAAAEDGSEVRAHDAAQQQEGCLNAATHPHLDQGDPQLLSRIPTSRPRPDDDCARKQHERQDEEPAAAHTARHTRESLRDAEPRGTHARAPPPQ